VDLGSEGGQSRMIPEGVDHREVQPGVVAAFARARMSGGNGFRATALLRDAATRDEGSVGTRGTRPDLRLPSFLCVLRSPFCALRFGYRSLVDDCVVTRSRGVGAEDSDCWEAEGDVKLAAHALNRA
jgi:hypothetical protein